MQVSVEAGEGLLRKMSVEVPSDALEAEVENRLQSMKGRIKMDGFRPGKVPLKVVKQRYGEQVLYEVAAEVMQKSFQDAVTQENLKLAGEPRISDQVIKPGEPLKFTAEFEIYPEVSISPVSELKLEKISCEVKAEDIENMLNTLQQQQTSWNESDAASADGDRVTIDFVGKVDGEAFEGGTANSVPVIIGSKSMVDGFEDNLKGKKKDEETTFEVTFPSEYPAENLAGKPAEFAVTVKSVETSSLPELDDDFAKIYGVEEGGIDKLREDIRNNLERELANRIHSALKNNVMDQLVEANQLDIPDSVVVQEMESLRQASSQQGLPAADDDSLRSEAERRVKLGMILGELVKQANLQPTREMVNERIQTMAQDYEAPEEFINHYQSNPQLLQGVESLVIEDMMVDWVAEQASVTEVPKEFDDVMKS